ncbi:hypothetical protein BLA29_012804, partial [Euroglyphus maynei]
MALIEFVAQVATIFTLFSFLTGIGYLWLRYGFMLDDPTMIFVNVIGFTLQSLYLFWFYIYTVPK